MLPYFKTGLDLLVRLMNIFPGYKTKVGAVVTALGTLIMAYNLTAAGLVGFHVPDEIALGLLATGQMLTAAGAANLLENNKVG